MGPLSKRVTKVEESLVIGADRQKFERRFRFHYNLRLLTTEALDVDMLCLLGRIERPGWIRVELEKPVPPNTPKTMTEAAQSDARNSMKGAAKWTDDELLNRSGKILPDCIKRVPTYACREIATFDDLSEWLSERGDRPGYQSVMEAMQDHRGRDAKTN